jgi:hypothetical protein
VAISDLSLFGWRFYTTRESCHEDLGDVVKTITNLKTFSTGKRAAERPDRSTRKGVLLNSEIQE